jgi:hypothetical protein
MVWGLIELNPRSNLVRITAELGNMSVEPGQE